MELECFCFGNEFQCFKKLFFKKEGFLKLKTYLIKNIFILKNDVDVKNNLHSA